MRMLATRPTRTFAAAKLQCGLLVGVGLFFCAGSISAQSTSNTSAPPATNQSQHTRATKAHPHRSSRKETPAPVVQAPPPPPTPNWPINERPNPASVVWDSNGLRINASNSSLQQILSEVSTETGTKVEGAVPDLRVYGDYGPGQARDVLSQLLQGSGYNVLLAGDLGKGAPREIVLSPRQNGTSNSPNGVNRPQDSDEDVPDEPEDQPVNPPAQPPQTQNNARPGFGPGSPIRTPQQVMEEMQQRQQQQQQQQANPPQ